MKKIIIFCFALLFSVFFTQAQTDENDIFVINQEDTTIYQKAYHVYDTGNVVKQFFNQESLTDFREDSRYQYEKGEVKENDTAGLSWWDKLIYKVFRWIAKTLYQFYQLFTNESGEFTIVFYLVMFVLFAGVMFFFIRILQGKFLRKGKGQNTDLAYETLVEDIHEMDFDILLKEAIEQKIYRRAVRILFLKSLKELTDKKIILWEENKTNRDYFYEIKSTKIQAHFDSISNVFNYVWYGEIELTNEKFNQIQSDFLTFSKEIQQVK